MRGISHILKNWKKSVAIFSSYFESERLPEHVQEYLSELSHYFDQVILVTTVDLGSAEDQKFMKKYGIQLEVVVNEGFDFGMHTKVIKKLKLGRIKKLGLFNDSVILCGSLAPFFRWENVNPSNVVGMVDSNEVHYHLQSYFLIFKGSSIRFLKKFLVKQSLLEEKLQMIFAYEVGLTRQLLKKGFSVDSFLRVNDYRLNFQGNPSFLMLEELLAHGLPLIKKKIISGNFNEGELGSLKLHNFDFSKDKYLKVIREVNPDFRLPSEFN